MGADMGTRTENVIARLREAVLDGAYTAGTHLQEVTLATDLRVSRTPIRDALRILANEGLLTYAPNRGYFVRHYSTQDILDAYDVRSTLESMACRIAAERGLDPATELKLKEIVALSNKALYGRSWAESQQSEWRRLNTEFHFTINEFTGNQHLIRMTREVRKFPRILDSRLDPNSEFYRSIYNRQRRQQSHAEHIDILDAIRNRQGTRAEALMREHVYRGRQLLENRLEEKPRDVSVA
jgi:GntR family transcriptional regulator of vanillate catabolism